MTLRVVEWSTGTVGRHAIEGIDRHPDLELVGVWVSDPAKVGKDAGRLAGLDRDLGVVATNDKQALLDLKPDAIVHTAMTDDRIFEAIGDLTEFVRAGVNVGVDITVEQLQDDFDAVVLAGGATAWRDLPIPGRELEGIYQAMEYLPWGNRVQLGDDVVDADGQPPITAKGKKVVIIGGGDTGADCLGTAHRQGAESIHQFEIMPRPPEERAESTPWPTYPLMFRVSSAHEEGGERVFSVNTEEFVGVDGKLTALKVHEVVMNAGKFEKVEGSDFELAADIVFLAMGFVGPEREGLLTELGVELTDRGNVSRDNDFQTTEPGVFVAGDMGRGQSLIVWAIAEGRAAAAGVDRFLMGETALPVPIKPTAAPQR